LDDDTLFRLRQAISKLARQLNRTAPDESLTPSQYSTLSAVVRSGSISMSELARVEGLNPTMLSRIAGHLHRAGLVNRVSGPADLRSVMVTATAQGSMVAERIWANRAKVMASAASDLSAEQQGYLIDALPSLEALVERFKAQRPGID
jgi:DNA-binding MarR family transcriptional regulator